MALTRVKLQSTRELDLQTYYFHPPAEPKVRKSGLSRVVFTSLTFLLAAFMFYVAMHYVPALTSPSKTIRFATDSQTIPSQSTATENQGGSILSKIAAPYQNLFLLDRAYLRSGETVQITFDLPETATVDLRIVQCKRMWVVEIFHCNVLSEFTSQKGPGKGLVKYTLGDAGFYHFRHKINNLQPTDSYSLVWERAIPEPEKRVVNPSLRRN